MSCDSYVDVNGVVSLCNVLIGLSVFIDMNGTVPHSRVQEHWAVNYFEAVCNW